MNQKKCNELLTKVKPIEKTEIPKMPHWNQIKIVASEIKSKHGIKFITTTNDVDNYIKNIKKNYALMCLDF